MASKGREPDYRAVFEAAQEPYLLLDSELVIAAANEAYLNVTMTRRSEIIGRPVFDVFPENPQDADSGSAESVRASFQRVLEQRRPDAIPLQKYDIPTPDGGYEVRYWRPNNAPVFDKNGEVGWILHHAEDLTATVAVHAEGLSAEELAREQARMRAQLRVANRDLADKSDENQRLQQERLLLASIVASSQDAIISKTLNGIVTSWNEAAERIYGYSALEMIGQPVTRLFPADLMDEEVMILTRMREGRRMAHYETRRVCKDGSEIDVSLSISPIREANGRIVGISKIARDITARKQAERRLAGLQAELIHMSRWNTVGIMASSITHDLNQPLAASTNYLAALKRLIAAPQPKLDLAGDIVEKAAQQTRRAGQIVQQLRAFISKGQPERKRDNVVQACNEALELARPAVRAFNVAMKVEASSDLPPAAFDRVQIQQVLINLLRNAAEAMSESPQREIVIRVVRSQEERALQVEVADTGPGLAPEVAGRLFEPFVTTKSSGMGLGLSICHEIVRAHGGRMWTMPNHPSGTVFALTLPLEALSQAA